MSDFYKVELTRYTFGHYPNYFIIDELLDVTKIVLNSNGILGKGKHWEASKC